MTFDQAMTRLVGGQAIRRASWPRPYRLRRGESHQLYHYDFRFAGRSVFIYFGAFFEGVYCEHAEGAYTPSDEDRGAADWERR
jgi:hypothetical protein